MRALASLRFIVAPASATVACSDDHSVPRGSTVDAAAADVTTIDDATETGAGAFDEADAG